MLSAVAISPCGRPADSIVDFPTPPGPAIMVTPSAPEVTETCSGTRPRCDAAHHSAG